MLFKITKTKTKLYAISTLPNVSIWFFNFRMYVIEFAALVYSIFYGFAKTANRCIHTRVVQKIISHNILSSISFRFSISRKHVSGVENTSNGKTITSHIINCHDSCMSKCYQFFSTFSTPTFKLKKSKTDRKM